MQAQSRVSAASRSISPVTRAANPSQKKQLGGPLDGLNGEDEWDGWGWGGYSAWLDCVQQRRVNVYPSREMIAQTWILHGRLINV